MGYTTEFEGRVNFNKPLDDELYVYLQKFSNTRRMKRNLGPEYGVEGEFYVEGGGQFGQDKEANIVEYNEPSQTQPGLGCQWVPTEDRRGLEWNGTEKFYEYVPWLKYLINVFLMDKGYLVNGIICYQGEELGDYGFIEVKDNQVILNEKGTAEPTLAPEQKQIGS